VRTAGGGAVDVGVTPKSQVRHAADADVPPATLYWFASQTLPVPVAAGSGLAPE
jgi:hypothetical protein